MSKRIPLAVGLLVLALAACQPATGVGTSTPKAVKKASAPRVAVPVPSAPGAVTQPTSTPATLPPATTTPAPQPTTAATNAPTAAPTKFRPSRAPEAPLPSGYVSPLPPETFPSADTSTPQPVSTATAVPLPPVVDATIVANSLPFGEGELTGFIVEPNPAQAGDYRPVQGVTIAITAVDDTTKKATLKNGTNGTYRLPELALGAYYVRVEKSGYAADSAPTTVRIYPGSQSRHSTFVILPE